MKTRPRSKLFVLLLLLFGLLALTAGGVAGNIYSYGSRTSDAPAEAAIVLGAAVEGKEPSPVFQERINHAIELYRQGKVKQILFTGGKERDWTEAEVAKAYALRQGVPAAAILMEDRSHTTLQNLRNTLEIARQNHLRRFLLVSDPLHMKRAMTMATDLGLSVAPSPTPTTRYRTTGSQLGMLERETRLYLIYKLGFGQ